jgi:hypothetical protein
MVAALLGGLFLAAGAAGAKELGHAPPPLEAAPPASSQEWSDRPDGVTYARIIEASSIDMVVVSSTDPRAASGSRMALNLGFGGFFSLLIAMMCAPTGLRHRKLATLNKEARPVPAVILSSKVDVSTEMRERGEFTWYTPKVKYAYSHEDAAYQGERLRPGDTRTQVKKEAEEIAAKYPEGAKVMAYVDPRDPGDATLELHLPKYRPFLHLAVGFGSVGAVLVLISTVMFLL